MQIAGSVHAGRFGPVEKMTSLRYWDLEWALFDCLRSDQYSSEGSGWKLVSPLTHARAT